MAWLAYLPRALPIPAAPPTCLYPPLFTPFPSLPSARSSLSPCSALPPTLPAIITHPSCPVSRPAPNLHHRGALLYCARGTECWEPRVYAGSGFECRQPLHLTLILTNWLQKGSSTSSAATGACMRDLSLPREDMDEWKPSSTEIHKIYECL